TDPSSTPGLEGPGPLVSGLPAGPATTMGEDWWPPRYRVARIQSLSRCVAKKRGRIRTSLSAPFRSCHPWFDAGEPGPFTSAFRRRPGGRHGGGMATAPTPLAAHGLL